MQRHDELQSIDVRHLKIRDDDVDAPSLIYFEGLLSIRGEMDIVTHAIGDVSQDHPVRFFVLDDEYTCHDARSFG